MALQVVSANRIDDEAWDGYVTAHPQATGYHLRGWRTVVERSFGHRCESVVALEEGRRVKGLLPLFFLRRWPWPSQLVSGPFGSYDGAIADSPEVELLLYEAAQSLSLRLRAESLLVKSPRALRALSTDGWLEDSRSHTRCLIDLPESADLLWKRLPSEKRNRIRKAKKAGLVVKTGWEHVAGFYAAFSRNMRDLGSPVQPQRFFEALPAGLGPKCRLYTVWAGAEVIGGSTYFSCRGTAYTPWLSCVRKHFKLEPYALLYWTMMSEACGRESTFDLGRSTIGPDGRSATQTAKQRWGAATLPVYHYSHFPRGREPAAFSADGKAARAFVSAWKRVPLPLANTLGPRLLRYHIAR